MKKVIIVLSFVAGMSFSLVGCSDYLDSDYLFDERISIEEVFSNRDYTDEWLARAYAYLGDGYMQDISSKKKMPYNFADDMYFSDMDDAYKKWKYGMYNENGVFGESAGIWSAAYKGIRQASIFVNHIDMLNDRVTAEERTDYKGQARFLKAYFYWILLRTFGPVPIISDEGIDYMREYDNIAQPRNTYEECVNYICEELVKAANELPRRRGVSDVVRPTCGAALALRAKVLLFAASPLYNGEAPIEVYSALVDKHGRHLLPDTPDESKWAKAAAAAKDVMDLKEYELYKVYARTSGSIQYPATIPCYKDRDFSENDWPLGYRDIDPFESYRSLFNGSVQAYENPELIFTRGRNQSSEGINILVLHQLPRSYGYGYGSHGMTQKQCDAYYMRDGSDCPGMNDMYASEKAYLGRYNNDQRPVELVTESELNQYPELGELGVGVCKQYAGREPRFYASVSYNGSTWNFLNAQADLDEVKNQQIWYYCGDTNGYQPEVRFPRSGITVKKYVHPDDIGPHDYAAYNTGRLTEKVDPAIRYAEILLIYAEALNELGGNSYDVPSWDGSKVHSVKREITEMKKGIRPVRMRAGVPDYSADVYNDQDKFRMKLKRERQIELFAEGHRYFDLRRWMDAPAEEALPVYGCNVYASRKEASLFYTPIVIPAFPTIFTTKMWFCPINHEELIRNKELTQNPGWTDPE